MTQPGDTGAARSCQVTLTVSRQPDILRGMITSHADYGDRLRQIVTDSADALRASPRKAKYVKGTRKARYPHDRAEQIRALADLVNEATYQLREEIWLARDLAATVPTLSYAAIGNAASITRQAAYEQVGAGRKARSKPLGPLPLAAALIGDDDDA